MSALKWIIAEAKKIKKQYPKRFSTWREYVAQASAIYASKHKGKSPVGKKHKVGAVKKTATKKPVKKTATKKATPKSYHKDTKSHNVNIRVMSGITKSSFDMLKIWQNVYSKLAHQYISATTVKERQQIKKEMSVVKSIISDTKKLKNI